MLPFYFLSITTNLIMGLILVFFDRTVRGDEPADRENKYPVLREPTFLLLVTIFSGFTAISKMLSPIGTNIVILGDFLPVVAGLAGSIVFLGRYLESISASLPDFFGLVKNYDEIIGYVCLASSVLHLLFSKVIFI
ncbi:hypothetical protein [Treponema putidum]|uniref:Uncharacterized protein n=1 Tax=Treponema putidum TaxID=221027 RepID=A0ABY5HTV8_9SPIR|nr:hypothetical protein [Treponema putidum]UTY28595.1 hypothetical protein E4N76_06020 [Treponema putidum]